MRTIGLTTRQYTALSMTKDLFEEDFRKKISFGEFVVVLVQGYLEGRSIIEKHSEIILTVAPELVSGE